MTGQPKKLQVLDELERRARDMDHNGATALDYVCSWISSGRTPLQLSRELELHLNIDLHRTTLLRYLTAAFGAEAGARMEQARQEGAHGLAEDAMSIIDDAKIDRDALAKAKMQSDSRLWLAERWNKRELAGARGMQVNVTVGVLHLDALRKRTQNEIVIAQPESRAFITTHGEGSAPTDGQSVIAPAIAVDAEIISIEDTDS